MKRAPIISVSARLLFRLRHYWWGNSLNRSRTLILRFYGARIGRQTFMPRAFVTWPHQLQIGSRCKFEPDIAFKFDGVWSPGPSIIFDDDMFVGRGCEFNIRKHIKVGRGSMIASGCKFVDHDHGITGERIDETPGDEKGIEIGNYVWLGASVIVLKGVRIDDGAVVAAGAVVTKSIPAGEIWAGVPARKISSRELRANQNVKAFSDQHWDKEIAQRLTG
jgi:acetyltransferase-like isoleucine patch superfamily enzyme